MGCEHEERYRYFHPGLRGSDRWRCSECDAEERKMAKATVHERLEEIARRLQKYPNTAVLELGREMQEILNNHTSHRKLEMKLARAEKLNEGCQASLDVQQRNILNLEGELRATGGGDAAELRELLGDAEAEIKDLKTDNWHAGLLAGGVIVCVIATIAQLMLG